MLTHPSGLFRETFRTFSALTGCCPLKFLHALQPTCRRPKSDWKYTVWVKKKSPLGDLTFFHFFHKRLRICNRFFTHLLNVPIFARLHISIQLSPILTKLCHIKRDYPVHIICVKCPKRAKTRAFRRLRRSLIALLIVVCGKSKKIPPRGPDIFSFFSQTVENL